MVLVMGTSSCAMLNARVDRAVPGIAGVVEGGILPGYYGYEAGQAAVGDAFAWFRDLVGRRDFVRLTDGAAGVAPGADGITCMDWFNGCRTPHMDGDLRGAFTGLSLAHGPAHLFRAMLEASACGVRWIVDLLEARDVPVKSVIATGGIAQRSPLLVQICADVLARPVSVHPAAEGPALGAAILGALAAGRSRTGFGSASAAIRGMASGSGEPRRFKPTRGDRAAYDEVYRRYRDLAAALRR
jgi:L-ribulokinase